MPIHSIDGQQLLSRLRQIEVHHNNIDLQRITVPQIEISRELIPYTLKKKKVMIYRAIFSLIGVLFFTLAYVIHSMVPLPICHQLFHNCFILHGMVKFFCAVSGLGAFILSFCLNAEKEAWKSLVEQGEKKLAYLLAEKEMKLERYHSASYAELRSLKKKLEESYAKTVHSFREKCQEIKHLLVKISSVKKISSAHRERLFNQALSELQLELNQLAI